MKHKYLYFSVFIGFVLAFGVSVMLSYKQNCVEEHSILLSVPFAQYKDYFLTGFLFDYLGINCQGKYNEFSTVLPHDSYIMSYSIGSAHTFCVQEECQRLVMKLESCVLADKDNGELTQMSKCLWLSSDFSLKRSLLLRNGELNADNKIWGCRLIDGRIRKLK